MREWKHAPRIYPVNAARGPHDRADRIANSIVAGVVLGAMCLWAGFEIGYTRGDRIAETDQAAVPRITSCPKSTADQDVIEHAWMHQGVVIHRECLIVSKPVYATPRYSHRPPNVM